MAHNVTHRVVNNTLIVEIDISPKALAAAPPSKTGKTDLVGTTGGTVKIEGKHSRELSFAINVMAKK